MNLYISNLSYNISDEDLRLLFADYGEITSANIIYIKYQQLVVLWYK